MTKLSGMFKSRYPDLQGRDWLNSVDEDDKVAFGNIGYQHTIKKHPDFHRQGGLATAQQKLRCTCGSFVATIDEERLALQGCWHTRKTGPYELGDENDRTRPENDFPF